MALTTKNNGNVEIICFSQLKDLLGDEVVEHAVVTTPNGDKTLDVNGVFVAIGRDPSSNFLQNIVDIDRNYIVVDASYQTSCKGIFAAGDCIPKQVRQVVTAVSDGAIVAKNVSAFLQQK